MYLVSSLHVGPYPSWASDEPCTAQARQGNSQNKTWRNLTNDGMGNSVEGHCSTLCIRFICWRFNWSALHCNLFIHLQEQLSPPSTDQIITRLSKMYSHHLSGSFFAQLGAYSDGSRRPEPGLYICRYRYERLYVQTPEHVDLRPSSRP